jgi:hypothetical protein
MRIAEGLAALVRRDLSMVSRWRFESEKKKKRRRGKQKNWVLYQCVERNDEMERLKNL